MADTAIPLLVGPPEIHNRTAAPKPESVTPEIRSTGNPFLDAMDTRFNSTAKGLTENQSPTFLSSGDSLLDFFFQVVPDTPSDAVTNLLAAAWARDPLASLKLVCNLRGVRGTGKSDRESFYAAALWLHRHHPKTLALNAASIANFGYIKDLPEILHRLVAGPKTPPPRSWPCLRRRNRRRDPEIQRSREKTREDRLAAEQAKVKIRMEEAAELRRRKRTDAAARAVELYKTDPDYRFLQDRASDYLAGLLIADVERYKSGDLRGISLAAKWCPSLDSSYDRSTLLCESIARRIFPKDSKPGYSEPEYSSIPDAHYAYRIRDRLRREVLVPLRRALELPEVYIAAGQWGSLPYNRVASVAMKNYKKLFQKHDPDRFAEFLSRVKEGKAKIAAGALLPHQILKDEDEVADLQWQRMVSDLAGKGKLKDCIAVCDVSGSMSGTPMEVCIALGILISELSEEPWKGRVITFSRDPEMHRIQGESIKEKAAFVRHMSWGMNTDFQRVFDKILQVAADGKVDVDRMVKRVFVFSDMEFDQASANSWETDYEAICRKFLEAGYGSVVPEIVFWNLRDSRSTPVLAGQKGVALVSGYSKNMIKVFLEGGGVVDPRAVMEAAIKREEYNNLVVFD